MIYWLVDVRPEMIAAGYIGGYPFYCGKTSRSPKARLFEHKRDSTRNPYGKVGPRVAICGDHVQIHTVEVVTPDGDWRERERHWIKILQFSFSDNCNISEGGDGAPGIVRSETWRINNSKRLAGRTLSAETRARISASLTGKTPSAETKVKLSNGIKDRWKSDEYRLRQSERMKAKWASPEHRAKVAAAKAARA